MGIPTTKRDNVRTTGRRRAISSLEKKKEKQAVDFITITSHQLRTPLTVMKWYLDLLLSQKAGNLTEQQKDFLREIYRANERMVRLVDNLTLVSTIDNRTFRVTQEELDVCDMIGGILGEYRLFASAYDITIINNCSQGVPLVMADPIFIRMAIKNILDNAIRYTLKGGTVVVECGVQGKDVLIRVTDSGVGIDEDEKKKIFTKFFRSASVVQMQTEGTGLGLYIARAVIEAHGGRIWFESEIGKGTTFFFTVPQARSASA